MLQKQPLTRLTRSVNQSPNHSFTKLPIHGSPNQKNETYQKFNTLNLSQSNNFKANDFPMKPPSCSHKEYLKNLLFKRFLKKYGGDRQNEFAISSAINNEIISFMKTEKVNRETVKVLEERIANKLRLITLRQNSLSSKPTFKESRISIPKPRRASQVEFQSIEVSNRQNLVEEIEPNQESCKVLGLSERLNQELVEGQQVEQENQEFIKTQLSHENEWVEVAKFRSLQHETDQINKIQDKKEHTQQFKSELDAQVKAKRGFYNTQKLESNKYTDILRGQLQIYKAEELQLKQQKYLNQTQEMALRQEEIKDFRKRTKEAKKLKRLQELKEAAVLTSEIKAQKNKELQKRQSIKEMHSRMIADNERNKELTLEAKKAQKQLDIALAQQYSDKIEEQERQKRLEMQRREDKIKVFMEKMQNSVKVQEDKKAKLMEDNILAYQLKKDRDDKRDEENRKKRIGDRQEKLLEDLSVQIEQKRKQRQLSRELNSEFIKEFKQRQSQEEEKERQAMLARREQEVKIKSELREQMLYRKKHGDGMTKEEFEMNKGLLMEIIAKKRLFRETIKKSRESQLAQNMNSVPIILQGSTSLF